MSTITHPILVIMAQWLASIIIKTGAKICDLFQSRIKFDLKIVILLPFSKIIINNVYLCNV